MMRAAQLRTETTRERRGSLSINDVIIPTSAAIITKDKFTLIEKLGEGASAKVFKGSFIVLLIEAS
jgi:hypothetical protein